MFVLANRKATCFCSREGKSITSTLSRAEIFHTVEEAKRFLANTTPFSTPLFVREITLALV